MITPEIIGGLPLTLMPDGTVRIADSRVSLDVVVRQFRLGASPEHIRESFPSLSLRDVYGALFFYLDHEQDVEAYLRWQEEQADEMRRLIESGPLCGNRPGLRDQMLARAGQLQTSAENSPE